MYQVSKTEFTIETPASPLHIANQLTALHHLESIMHRHVNSEALPNSDLGCHLRLHPVALDGCLHSMLLSLFERQIGHVLWRAHRGTVQLLQVVHLKGNGLGHANVGLHGCQEKNRKLLTILQCNLGTPLEAQECGKLPAVNCFSRHI